jgi:hypothetical protein
VVIFTHRANVIKKIKSKNIFANKFYIFVKNKNMTKANIVFQEIKQDLENAKKDKFIKKQGSDWDTCSWGYEQGYIMSYKRLETIVNYIQTLKYSIDKLKKRKQTT